VPEPDRLMRADELEARVCAYYDYEWAAHLAMLKNVV
jgi:hypothetical protein